MPAVRARASQASVRLVGVRMSQSRQLVAARCLAMAETPAWVAATNPWAGRIHSLAVPQQAGRCPRAAYALLAVTSALVEIGNCPAVRAPALPSMRIAARLLNGCGVPQDCGSCPSTGPWFCGLVTPNQCYGCEVPKTCADFPPGTCGLQANGCGVLLDCGPCSTCDLPKTCEQVCAVSNSVPTCSSVYDAASGFVVRCQQPTGCTDSPIQYCWCFIG